MAFRPQHLVALMENQACFCLESSIAEWRHEVHNAKTVTPEQQAELENHLRDEIIRLRESGLAEHEAFMIALQRLGKINDIANEFSKVNQLSPRPGSLCKMFIGLCTGFSVFFLYLAGSVLSYGGERFHARVMITDALGSAFENGFRKGFILWFVLGLLFSAATLITFLRVPLSRKNRFACVAVALVPPLSLLFADFGNHSPWELATAVISFLFSLPAHTLRVLSGKECGEYFQDSLTAGPAAGWWMLLWLVLGGRELFYAIRRTSPVFERNPQVSP